MLILITGGSKNGKSHIAEEIIEKMADGAMPRYYLATMEPYCDEARIAIERHRRIRAGKGFTTIERYTDIGGARPQEGSAVLLECACNLCANEMFTANELNPADKIVSGIAALLESARLLVIVTNQVGADAIRYPKETEKYIAEIGKLNLLLAQKADCVIEAVYGIPLVLKGELCLS